MEKVEVELANRQQRSTRIINDNDDSDNDDINNDNDSNNSDENDDDNSDNEYDDQQQSLIRKKGVIRNDDQKVILGDYILDDLKKSIYNARFALPFFVLVSIIIAYLITVAPYQVQISLNNFNSNEDIGAIRPILSQKEQNVIRRNLMLAETQFWMPSPSYNIITMKFHQQVSKHGNFHPPQLFYDGVVFGISSDNAHDLNFTAQNKNSVLYKNIKDDLTNMNPKPTNVFQRASAYVQTGFQEQGWAIYFHYDDLAKQGRLSSDKLRPWKRVLDDVLNIARDYRQVSITAWYPNVFGDDPGPDSDEDRNKYKNIIQEVIPTRTGLDYLKSTVTVWMSHVNATAVKKKNHVYRRMWTEEDPYFHMLTDEQKKIVIDNSPKDLLKRRDLRSLEIEVDGD